MRLPLLLALLALVTACEDAPRPGAPGSLAGRNVVLVVADSLHAAHLSSYGAERETSPFLARLAARGVRFEQAYSQTSWTLSSMVSVFTGLAQESHGVLRADERASEGLETLAELLSARGYRTVGIIQNGAVGPHTGLDQGFEQYLVVEYTEAGTEALLEAARSELDAPDERPLFLYVHLAPPHMPYQPPEPYLSRWLDPSYDGTLTGTIIDTALANRDQLPREGPDVRRLADLYDGHVAWTDDVARRLLEELLAPGKAERFALVFSSDHGEGFMQHGMIGHNAHVYEEMVRVPLILAAPGGGLPEGLVLPGPASLLDLTPTLCRLLGVPGPRQALDGRSLVALLEDPQAAPPPDIGPERPLFLSSRYPKGEAKVQYGLRQGRWKLVRLADGETWQLYDLERDPQEQGDLAAKLPERVADMRAELERRRLDLLARARRSGEAVLDAETLRRLEALGYGGEGFDSVTPGDR